MENQDTSSVFFEDSPLVINLMGDVGPPGASGAGGIYYKHSQSSASDTWTINHNLATEPNVSVFSVGGREMVGEILHSSTNTTIIYFDSPIAGYAICS